MFQRSPLPPVSMMPTPGVGGAVFGDSGERSNRYGPVTRTETLKSEQKTRILDLSCPIGLDVFCDWLTIYQDHPEGNLPILNDGYVVRYEAGADFSSVVDFQTGEYKRSLDLTKAEYTVSRKMEHEGSYDTKISIRCDGRRVELSGNVGRFGRTDNLFGLSVLETVARANEILEALGLPPFSAVQANFSHARDNGFHKLLTLVEN